MKIFETIGIIGTIFGAIFGVSYMNKYLNLFGRSNDEKLKKDVHDISLMSAVDKARLANELFRTRK